MMNAYNFCNRNDDSFWVVADTYENALKIAYYYHGHGYFDKMDNSVDLKNEEDWGVDVYYENSELGQNALKSTLWEVDSKDPEDEEVNWTEVTKW